MNGNILTNSSLEEGAPVLKMANFENGKRQKGKILIQVRRLRFGNGIPGIIAVQQNKNDGLAPTGDKSLLRQPVINGSTSVIELRRGEHGLGFSIVGGFGTPHGDMPVYVKTVFDTGPAAEHGGLKRADQILSVNGISLKGLTHLEAVDLLKYGEETDTYQIIS